MSHALCNCSVLTRSGCLAASHVPVDAPSETPKTCAWSIPTASMNAATSSANNSVE